MNSVATHKERVRDHFDRWSETYDQGHITRWLRAFQQKTIDTMHLPPDAAVLDVGCGTGWAVRRLGELLPEGHASGLDLSPAMIGEAERTSEGLDNVDFRVGDSEHLPYEDGSFDAVMCSSSFHHYPNPVRALSEFRRVLKPGGRAYVLDPCRDGSFLMKVFDIGHKLFVGDHVRYYHTREMMEFFGQAEFSDVREEFRVQGLFIHGKLVTSEALISGART